MRPLWSYGFRPFFLLASLSGAALVIVWVFVLRGQLPAPTALPLFSWHAHEMLFGFTAAVLAGFLLTAVRNWTGGQPTLEGRGLMALVVIWLLARVLALWPSRVPPTLHIFVDAAFFVGLALAIAVPLVKTANKRNLALPPLLLLLGSADVAMHIGALGAGPLWLPLATVVALNVPLLFLVVIGGRVLPFFTRNGLRGAGALVRDPPALAYAGLVAVALVVLSEMAVVVMPSAAWIAAIASALAGVLLLVRLAGWQSWATRKLPVLAVLHVGWAFLGVGYLLMAVARLWPTVLAPTTALHTLTVGGLALIILGMMSRVSLGHTGRPILVRRSVVVGYALLVAAALVRVAVPALLPGTKLPYLDIAALLFAGAFGIFFVVYLPILIAPRADEPVKKAAPPRASLALHDQTARE